MIELKWAAVIALWGFVLGGLIGTWGRDRIWRQKGDHPYMNRMASGGRLYQVKRE